MHELYNKKISIDKWNGKSIFRGHMEQTDQLNDENMHELYNMDFCSALNHHPGVNGIRALEGTIRIE